jgi:hypothetical protein
VIQRKVTIGSQNYTLVYGDFRCFLHWQYPDFWHFQTDHGRKVNCSYSWITCMIRCFFFFSFFDGNSLYFLIIRKCYLWLNRLLLSELVLSRYQNHHRQLL